MLILGKGQLRLHMTSEKQSCKEDEDEEEEEEGASTEEGRCAGNTTLRLCNTISLSHWWQQAFVNYQESN